MKVGVTDFVDENESPIDTLVITEEAERTQLESVRRTRAARDTTVADDALIALKEAATTDVNLMEPILDCARARCTGGEIVGALASVFGTYRETPRASEGQLQGLAGTG